MGVFLTFPSFNIHSTPLLVLVLQGLLFAILLGWRYRRQHHLPDLLLCLILLITCYHRTSYTIGFMDWYDTYRNTKINYYLVDMSLLLAPLIYFYLKSVTVSDFRLKGAHLWHALPFAVYFALKMVILAYDSNQPGFADSQNGYLVEHFQWPYLDPVYRVFSAAQMLLYLAFSLQLYFGYRKELVQIFSNTYRLELNWIRNFLYVYSALFLYEIGQELVNELVTELHWTQKWWLHFLTALAIIYIGVKGYFTDTTQLSGLEIGKRDSEYETRSEQSALDPGQQQKLDAVRSFFDSEKPYLDPDLNLIQLASQLGLSRVELSGLINTGTGGNFNDFVNAYRVKAVQSALASGKQQHLSLMGIAFDCGFNSKATFNRVFKKQTGQSPTQYVSSL